MRSNIGQCADLYCLLSEVSDADATGAWCAALGWGRMVLHLSTFALLHNLMYAREEPSIYVLSPFISLQIWIVIDYFLTFALAKETDGTAATLVVVAKEIFEIIDIDKQKCSNKRLGNERPNRQLRPLLR